jgi:nuclear transport factor 2 (NTF2) superfamily protein
MDREGLGSWLDRYVEAWRSGAPASIGELFSEEATYRYHPFEDPVIGRDSIVASWLEDPDEPDAWEARYEPFAVDGDRAVARGVTRYVERAGQQARVYDNAFLMEFDEAGQCRSFIEWFRTRPAPPSEA